MTREEMLNGLKEAGMMEGQLRQAQKWSDKRIEKRVHQIWCYRQQK